MPEANPDQIAALVDADLIAEYLRCKLEPDDPRCTALAEEIARRELDL